MSVSFSSFLVPVLTKVVYHRLIIVFLFLSPFDIFWFFLVILFLFFWASLTTPLTYHLPTVRLPAYAQKRAYSLLHLPTILSATYLAAHQPNFHLPFIYLPTPFVLGNVSSLPPTCSTYPICPRQCFITTTNMFNHFCLNLYQKGYLFCPSLHCSFRLCQCCFFVCIKSCINGCCSGHFLNLLWVLIQLKKIQQNSTSRQSD